ncbi:MAG: hypothetical protein ABJM86_09800, partial [Hyphomicrobiales bacterium]
MKSQWSDSELQKVLLAAKKVDQNTDIATRVYTTRLLGCDPELVLHGGGNTSVKTVTKTMDGTLV